MGLLTYSKIKLVIGELLGNVIFLMFYTLFNQLVFFKRTVEESIKFVANNFSPDFVLLTGDYIGRNFILNA